MTKKTEIEKTMPVEETEKNAAMAEMPEDAAPVVGEDDVASAADNIVSDAMVPGEAPLAEDQAEIVPAENAPIPRPARRSG